jgi:Pregnancy-associated plasma protein-A/Secretion system C-terminal sorting domain
MKKIFLAVFLSIPSLLLAQDRCGVAIADKKLQEKYSNWLQRKANFERQIQTLQLQNNRQARIDDKVYQIPVVVHVLHNNISNAIGGNNISDEQINSQIKVLNEDYRRKEGTNGYNTNLLGADMEIEFVLAPFDPYGNTSTGITRTYTNQNGFNLLDDKTAIANIIQWDTDKYLNIWVVKGLNGVIGFAGFPYDSKLDGLGANTQNISEQDLFDGVIIDYRNFGTCCGTLSQNYNLGRTTTHEVGHWLGLLHPNGDENCGTDYCDDTPQIEKLNLTTSCDKITSNCVEKVTNMIENYMDYSPDRCMNVFTNDQKIRTRAALNLSIKRQTLLNNIEPLGETKQLSLSVEPNPINISKNIRLKITFTGEKNLLIRIFDFQGSLVQEESLSNQKSNFISLKNESLRAGNYIVNVSSDNESVSKKIIIQP